MLVLRIKDSGELWKCRHSELVATALNVIVAGKPHLSKQFPNLGYMHKASLYTEASARACLKAQPWHSACTPMRRYFTRIWIESSTSVHSCVTILSHLCPISHKLSFYTLPSWLSFIPRGKQRGKHAECYCLRWSLKHMSVLHAVYYMHWFFATKQVLYYFIFIFLKIEVVWWCHSPKLFSECKFFSNFFSVWRLSRGHF